RAFRLIARLASDPRHLGSTVPHFPPWPLSPPAPGVCLRSASKRVIAAQARAPNNALIVNLHDRASRRARIDGDPLPSPSHLEALAADGLIRVALGNVAVLPRTREEINEREDSEYWRWRPRVNGGCDHGAHGPCRIHQPQSQPESLGVRTTEQQ